MQAITCFYKYKQWEILSDEHTHTHTQTVVFAKKEKVVVLQKIKHMLGSFTTFLTSKQMYVDT